MANVQMYHRIRVKLGCGDRLITFVSFESAGSACSAASPHYKQDSPVALGQLGLQTNWNTAVTQMQHQRGNYELCEDKIIRSLHVNNMPGQVTTVKHHILASYIIINK